MEDEQRELKASKQRRWLDDVVARLAEEHPAFYYLPTVEIAAKIEQIIAEGVGLTREERELVGALTRRDIQILLSVR